MVVGGGVGSSSASTKSSYFPFLSGNDHDSQKKPKAIGQLTKSFSGFSFTTSHHGSKGKHDCTTRTPSVASIESDYDYAYSRAGRMTLRVLNPDPHDSTDEEDAGGSDHDKTATKVTPPEPYGFKQSDIVSSPTSINFCPDTSIPSITASQNNSSTPKATTQQQLSTSPNRLEPILVRRQSKTLDEQVDMDTKNVKPGLFLPPLDLTPFDSSTLMPTLSPSSDYFRLSSSPYFALSTAIDPAPPLSTPINAIPTRDTATTTISSTPSPSESLSLDISSVPSPHQPQLSASNTVRTDETSVASFDFNSLPVTPETVNTANGSTTNPLLRALLQRDSIDNSKSTQDWAFMHETTKDKAPQPTTSISSKYAKASYSLTNHPDALLLYRDMAKKTGDKTVQYNYAKYLMEIAELYDQGRETKHGKIASIKYSLEEAGQRLRHELDHQLGHSTTISSSSTTSKRQYHENKSHRRKKRLLEEEGTRWMKRLAREHMPDAAFTVATWMDDAKYGFTRNPEKSFALYEIAAKGGIREASFKMGLYYESMGDHRSAMASLKKASDLGVVAATLKLAKVYLHGDLSQKQNITLALSTLYQATLDAKESCPEPPYMFGQILANTYPTIDIPRQIVEPYGGVLSSLPYFERAVQLSYAPAHSTLGYILEHGLYGLQVNYAQCYFHYTEAAKKGDARAMLGLARLHNQGSHGSGDQTTLKQRLARDESGWLAQRHQDEEASFYWCRKAADEGLADAEALLGWYYEIGLGTVRDLEKARWYYQKASRNTGQDVGYQQRMDHAGRLPDAPPTINTASHSAHSYSSTHGSAPRKESQQCVSM